MNPSYHYDNHLGLAELPYFHIVDQRLIRDPNTGPAIDVHTHLALSYLTPLNIDLKAPIDQTGVCQHYLPLSSAIDLEIYANRNYTPERLSELKRDLVFNGSFGRKGMRNTHTIPNLLAEMKEMHIAASLLLPIELPKISKNAEIYLENTAQEPKLISLGSVHPYDGSIQEIARRLERQKEMGAPGIKLHPAVQLLPPDHPRFMKIYEICGDLGLFVLWHAGPVDIETRWGRYCSQMKHYWPAIHRHPQTTFVLGHSGALQMDQGLALAQKYPNVYLEIASQSLPNVKTLVREAPIERLMFGTDWPFYHQSSGLAKILLATEGQPTERSMILYQNAAKLLNLPSDFLQKITA